CVLSVVLGVWISGAATVFSAMDSSLSFFKRRCALLAYLHSDLFGFGLFCLRECHRQQSMFIVSLDFVLVHFNGQLNMPHKLACGSFTTMECFRFHVPSYTPFLSCDAQGVTHDTQIDHIEIDIMSQGFYIH